MHKQLILPHLTTSNIYVKRQILRDNISRLENYLSNFKLSQMRSTAFREAREDRDKQAQLKIKLDKIIANNEQSSFPFGGFSSSY